MIRFGPAGIPLSCKGRTLKDGIEDVHNLSLTALEVQMVRPNAVETYPEDEDVGLTMREVADRLVVEIDRDGELICDPDEPIEEDDVLIQMHSGIAGGFGDLGPIGDMARRLDVSVSLHTPYYMDLRSDGEVTEACMDSIRHGGIIVDALGGTVVVTNLGLCPGSDDGPIRDNLEALMGWWREKGLSPKLGVEVAGHGDVFGSLEQVLDVCDEIEGLVPVVNFPHHHARTCGSLASPGDFQDLIDQVEPYCGGRIHTLFAGVEHADGCERRLTPIKKGDLKFDALAECMVESRPDITIISSSPLLEHDAMYMRIIYERYLAKKILKAVRARRKGAEGAAADGEDRG